MLLINTVAPLGLLLATPYGQDFSNSCLSQAYYGTHGQHNVFITQDEACIAESANHMNNGAVVALTEGVQQLVWLQQQAVDNEIKPPTFVDEFNMFFSRLSSPAAPSEGEQVVFGGRKSAQLLYRTTTSALVSVDSETALTLDQHLPRFWKASPLPPAPVPFIPVPSKAVDRVKIILDNLKFDPEVAAIVNNISVPQLRADVRYLTGEHPMSEIISRHSFSKGVLIAADWLKATFEAHGASCTLKPFLSGFAPNVIWCVARPFAFSLRPGPGKLMEIYGARTARTKGRRTRRIRCSSARIMIVAGRLGACARRAGTTTGRARRRCSASHALLRARASSSGRTSSCARLPARSRACTARATMRRSCTRRARTSLLWSRRICWPTTRRASLRSSVFLTCAYYVGSDLGEETLIWMMTYIALGLPR